MSAPKGFTLIELLVVISIIAVLSVIGITIFSSAQNAARNAKVQGDFNAIYKNIEQARIIQQKTLLQLTGNACSECGGCKRDMSTDFAACLSTMTASYAFTTATLPIDPWGIPYMWDENEGEGNEGSGICRMDAIRTVGPDHKYGTSDDKTFSIPVTGYVICP